MILYHIIRWLISSSLSDFSDYDSSDEEWRMAHGRPAAPAASGRKSGPSSRRPSHNAYAQMDEEPVQRKSLLSDDPFADDMDTPVQERQRMQCKSSIQMARAFTDPKGPRFSVLV